MDQTGKGRNNEGVQPRTCYLTVSGGCSWSMVDRQTLRRLRSDERKFCPQNNPTKKKQSCRDGRGPTMPLGILNLLPGIDVFTDSSPEWRSEQVVSISSFREILYHSQVSLVKCVTSILFECLSRNSFIR